MLILLLVLTFSLAGNGQVLYRGVNQAGAEFGDNGDTIEVDYTYPTAQSVDYFVQKGMNCIRFPFRWHRVQRTLGGALDATEMGRMDTFINYVTATKGIYLVLDPHDYARYRGDIIGASHVTIANFQDFWTKLANRYKSNSKVIFGLMNEPHTMDTNLWFNIANQTIQSIRQTGATNLILVPGNAWTGAHSWNQDWYGTPNGQVADRIVDPGNNFIYELHQYFDSDYSGRVDTCISATIGSEVMVSVTNWLRARGKKGFMGEFGGGRNNLCYQTIDNFMKYMHDNSDVWVGWTWWAAGPWWGDYIFTLEPTSGNIDRPQMSIISKYLTWNDTTSTTSSSSGSTTSSSSGAVISTTSGSAGLVSTTSSSSGSTTSSSSGTGTSTTSGSGSSGSTTSSSGPTGSSLSSTTDGMVTGLTTSNTTAPGEEKVSGGSVIMISWMLIIILFSFQLF